MKCRERLATRRRTFFSPEASWRRTPLRMSNDQLRNGLGQMSSLPWLDYSTLRPCVLRQKGQRATIFSLFCFRGAPRGEQRDSNPLMGGGEGPFHESGGPGFTAAPRSKMEGRCWPGGSTGGNAAPAACWEIPPPPPPSLLLPSLFRFPYASTRPDTLQHTHTRTHTSSHPPLSPILIHSSKLFSIFLISFSPHHTLIHSWLSPSLSFSLSLSLLTPPPHPFLCSLLPPASLSFVNGERT